MTSCTRFHAPLNVFFSEIYIFLSQKIYIFGCFIITRSSSDLHLISVQSFDFLHEIHLQIVQSLILKLLTDYTWDVSDWAKSADPASNQIKVVDHVTNVPVNCHRVTAISSKYRKGRKPTTDPKVTCCGCGPLCPDTTFTGPQLPCIADTQCKLMT